MTQTQSQTQTSVDGSTGAAPGVEGAMRSAKAPVGTGPAPLVAQLVALGLVVLGAVGIQEALVRSGAVSLPSWTSAVLDALGGTRHDAPLVLVVGIAAVVVGVLLLPLAFVRRPRTSVALRAETGVFLRRRDLAKVASSALEGVDSVTQVRVRSRRSRLRVAASTVAPKDRDQAIQKDVHERLTDTMAALDPAPRTRVRIRHEEI